MHKGIYYFVCLLTFSSTVGFSQIRPKKEPVLIIDSSLKGILPSSSPKRGSTNSNWSFLSLDACGIETYLKQHPAYDGRGTIIAILDDGVDPGIAGLLQTSEGKKKIIDVQDFAGSGDLYWESAERNGDKLIFNGKPVLSGFDKVNLHAYDGKYYFANLSERKFQNGLADLNFDGKKNNNFGVVVFQDVKDHWMAIVDGNGNGAVDDEMPLSNYKEHQDVFQFRAGESAEEKDGRYLTGGVNIFPDEHRINLYFADGGHGTHVAGIAGGYRIDGQTGFNGVAPGAEMIALKFADNTIDGVTVTGSMKRAYEYVIKVAQETDKPVIVNMSFGIGSELEGRSVMDQWLDSLLDAHPEVTVCIAAGNDGPGVSNVGLPGTARSVITSGACLPDDTGRDLYGIKMSNPIIWDFSSRGGELAKPDIVSPGTAISTVPDYVLSDRYNGTSMASPYTTGCCALLVSGMKQMFPDYKPNSNDIKRALQLGAVPFANMTLIDQGAGMVNVPNAFDRLVEWQRKNFHPRQYLVSVAVPSSVQKGTAAFYRNGIYPKNAERTTFTIMPVESSGAKSRERLLSFNAFELRSTASWLEPVQSSVYHRGEGPLQVLVSYDEKQLQKPGLYCAKIQAFAKGSPENSVPEFELWNTVIIPRTLSPENSFRSEVKDIRVRPGKLQREFFMIPAGTKAVKIALTSLDINSNVDAVIVNNDGRTFSFVHLKSDDEDGASYRYITGEDLQSGVWEIIVKRGLGSDDEKESSVRLTVEAVPLDIKENWLSLSSKGEPSGRFEITNSGSQELALESARADLLGYERYIDTALNDNDTYQYQFKAHPGERSATFDFSLAREAYDLFTDISYQILKQDGTAIVNGGFDLRNASAKCDFGKNDTATYILKFRGGLADPEKPHSFRLLIRERREIEGKSKDETLTCKITPPIQTLYPAQTENFRLSGQDEIPELPDGYAFYGALSFKTDDGRILIPITFAP